MSAAPARSAAARVLALMLAAGGPVSGQDMGRELGCSRAAVGKAVGALREQGFVIDARPGEGYRLVHEPDAVLPSRVEARLAPGGLGSPLIYFEETASTNLEARRLAEAGAPHGTTVAAEHQSAGRGRLDRSWQAPRGSSLLFSLILRPDFTVDRVFVLNNVVSLAICRALEAGGGLRPLIKWPNDVYLEGGKLAGILTEFTGRAERVDHVVVGVGLNVNLDPADLGPVRTPAVSLLGVTGRRWDRAALLASILDEASALYRNLVDGRQAELMAAYLERSLLRHRRVEVADGDTLRSGVVRGFAEDGALLLDQDGQGSCTVRHGDVSLLSLGEPVKT